MARPLRANIAMNKPVLSARGVRVQVYASCVRLLPRLDDTGHVLQEKMNLLILQQRSSQ